MRAISTFFGLMVAVTGLGLAQTPIVPTGGIVNGATFDGSEPIAPGALVSIFGTALAASTASADTVPLSTSLSGASVTFTSDAGSFEAPLLYAQPGDPASKIASQINAQVPWEVLPPGTSSATVNVVVTRDGASSQPAPVPVSTVSPGIFALGGRGFAANFPDNSLAWPEGAVAGVTSHPAKVGGVLVIYCTGLGALDSPIQSGQNSMDKLRNTLTKPVVLVGGVSAPVLFSGLTPQFVGVYQLNITVPAGVAAGDSVPLQIQMGGFTTPATASTIAISQ